MDVVVAWWVIQAIAVIQVAYIGGMFVAEYAIREQSPTPSLLGITQNLTPLVDQKLAA